MAKSVRLTKAVKENIAESYVNHLYEEPLKAMARKIEDALNRLVETSVSSEHKEAMAALPAWSTRKMTVMCVVFYADHKMEQPRGMPGRRCFERVQLRKPFVVAGNPFVYGTETFEGWEIEIGELEALGTRRQEFEKYHGIESVALIDKIHSLMMEKREALGDVKSATSTLMGVLSGINTAKALREYFAEQPEFLKIAERHLPQSESNKFPILASQTVSDLAEKAALLNKKVA